MVTKVLEATLVRPTTHKERKLTDSLDAYRAALRDAIAAGASTTAEVEAAVDAPSTALIEGAVPGLAKDASTLAPNGVTDAPLHLIEPSVVLDRDSNREHEFCWHVPTDDPFWIPLQVNPLQEELWRGLEGGAYRAVELELQQHTSNWVLTVEVEEAPEDAEPPVADLVDPYADYWTTQDPSRTPIGVDIGETALVTGCALSDTRPISPVRVDGRRAKHLRKEMYTTLSRLDERDAAEWRIQERFDYYRNALIDIIEKASREIVEYAKDFNEPVIVMEDIDVGGEQLHEAMFEHRRLNMWSFNRLVERIAEKANDADIPVAFVDPAYTSQTCHQCNHIGERDGAFECENDACWVSTYDGDINAAAVIAKRYNPWGETCRLKPDGDDSPRDGSPCDGATEPRERGKSSNHTSRNSSETTPAGHWLPDTDAGVSST